MIKYAVREDGALHAEKYYHTVTEEFAATRSAFRWRHLIALARVTASEHGHPAPGQAEARRLLGVGRNRQIVVVLGLHAPPSPSRTRVADLSFVH